MDRKIFYIFIVAVLVINCCGCRENTKVYTCGEGISLEMPAGMTEIKDTGYTYCLQGRKIIFTAEKQPKSDFAGSFSDVGGYFDYLMDINKSDCVLVSADNVNYFTYNSGNGGEYFYYAVIAESGDNFWLCNFICASDKKDRYESRFAQWADTIRIDD